MDHSGWSPDYVLRLFRRDKAYFSGDLVHERRLQHPNLQRDLDVHADASHGQRLRRRQRLHDQRLLQQRRLRRYGLDGRHPRQHAGLDLLERHDRFAHGHRDDGGRLGDSASKDR